MLIPEEARNTPLLPLTLPTPQLQKLGLASHAGPHEDSILPGQPQVGLLPCWVHRAQLVAARLLNFNCPEVWTPPLPPPSSQPLAVLVLWLLCVWAPEASTESGLLDSLQACSRTAQAFLLGSLDSSHREKSPRRSQSAQQGAHHVYKHGRASLHQRAPL